MAIAKAFVSTEMPSLSVWYGEVTTYNSSTIVITDGVRTGTYTGSFAYTYYGEVFGTLTGYRQSLSGSLQYEVTNISADANKIYQAIQIQGNFTLAATLTFAGADSLYGSSGSDYLRSYAANDVVLGRGGRDTLDGGTGNDRLNGGFGSDMLFGNSGNDRLLGAAGADRLFGDEGRDVLKGGNGNDQLNGGIGNDHLYGGSRADRFIFTGAFGDDTIHDFRTIGKAEKIDLSAIASITGFRDLKNNHLSEANGNAVIDDGAGNTVTLDGVAMADLRANDFLF